MTNLPDRLKRLVEFDYKPIHYIGDKATDEAIYSLKGSAYENARLSPLIHQLIQCVEALEKSVHFWFESENRAHPDGMPKICSCVLCTEKQALTALDDACGKMEEE